MKKYKIILSLDAKNNYNYLKKRIFNSKKIQILFYGLNKKLEIIKNNPHYGNPIAKKLIPKEYKLKYGINNLFRVELPSYWRVLYTLTNKNSKEEIIIFIIDIIDHKIYNKKFKYKKK